MRHIYRQQSGHADALYTKAILGNPAFASNLVASTPWNIQGLLVFSDGGMRAGVYGVAYVVRFCPKSKDMCKSESWATLMEMSFTLEDCCSVMHAEAAGQLEGICAVKLFLCSP